jgi:RHS repeat-associated protein
MYTNSEIRIVNPETRNPRGEGMKAIGNGARRILLRGRAPLVALVATLWTAAAGFAAPSPAVVANVVSRSIVAQTETPAALPRDRELDIAYDALERLAQSLRVIESGKGGLPKLRTGVDVSQLAIDLLAAGADLADRDALTAIAQTRDDGPPDGRRVVLGELATRHGEFAAILARLTAAETSRDETARFRAIADLAQFLDTRPAASTATRFDPASVRGFSADRKKLPLPGAHDERVPAKAAAAKLDPPGAADLAETDEVVLTAEIRAKAEELGRNPVAIRNWVYDNIDYAPGYGSTQNAQKTLFAKRGNAWDIHSLLVALLRASNIPARYVSGAVELPVERLREWLPVADASDAADLFSASGVPTTLLTSGGQIRALRFEHVWVEAWVDFTPSRGARNVEPDSWVPMDAAIKAYRTTAPVAYMQHVGFDAQAAQTEILAGAQQGPGWITGIDVNKISTVYDRLGQRALDYVNANPAADPAETFGARKIIPVGLPVLEGTLPYNVYTPQPRRVAALPANAQHAISVQLYASPGDIGLESPQFVVQMPLARMGLNAFQVEYRGASATDAATLKQYAASNTETLSASGLRVVPTLKLGGQVVQQGGSVTYGIDQYWQVQLRDPLGAFTQQSEPYKFPAGTSIAFVTDTNGVTPELAEAMTAGYASRQNLPIGDALAMGGLQFWLLHDLFDSWVAQARGATGVRLPSVGAFATSMRVGFFFGVPRNASTRGFMSDVKTVRYALIGVDAETARRAATQMGAMGSFAEGATWNLLTGGGIGDGLTASTLILRANEAKIPIYRIDASNVDQYLPQLALHADDKADIRAAANAGLSVLVPAAETTIGGWSGTGYLIQDPVSGGGVWRVSGGLNGAINVGCVAKAVLLNVLCKLMFNKLVRFFLGLTSPGAIAAMLLERLIISAIPVVGPIIAIVQVAIAVAQATAMVIRWVRSVEAMIEELTPEQLGMLGISDFNDALCSLGSPCFDSNFFDDIGDNFTSEGFSNDFWGNFMGGAFAGAGGPSEGNPVSVGNGIKWQREADYEGEGPNPLSFVRTYSSYVPNGSSTGNKWTHNYQSSIRVAPAPLDEDGEPIGNAPAALVTHGDGTYFQFTRRNNDWVGEGNLPEKLVRFADANGETTGWEVSRLSDEIERYDAAGRLVSVKNPAGLTHTLTYDANGRLEAVADGFGRSLRFTYDALGQLETMTDPANKATRYAYAPNGNLIKVTWPDDTSRSYHYEDPALQSHLTGLTDERGVRYATWAYDYRGRAILSMHAGGVDKYTFSYLDNATVVTDPLGTTRTYKFQRYGERPYLTEVTQACSSCSAGGAAKLHYDGRGLVDRATDFNGNATTFSRNARGLEESRTEAVGTPQARTIATQWHATWRKPTRQTVPTANGNRVTTWTYDDAGNLRSQSVAAGSETRTWTFTPNARGQVETIDGPRTDVADIEQLRYDAATGNRSTTTSATGQVTRYTGHDAHGRVTEERDANGLITEYRYDLRGRLTHIVRKVSTTDTGQTYVLGHDPAGNLTRVTLPDASYVEYTFDPAGRLTRIAESSGNTIDYVLDATGNRTSETISNAQGDVRQSRGNTFDVLGRVETLLGALPAEVTRYTYDGNGNQKTATDPSSSVVTSSYDALGRLTRSESQLPGEPDYTAIGYGYDAADNLTSVVDARNLTTSYAYNGFDEPATVVSPDAGTSRLTYDAAGNIATSTDARNQRGVYAYDAGNRLTQLRYGAADPANPQALASVEETQTFSYDDAAAGDGAQGRLARVVDAAGTTAYAYDRHGRLASTTQSLGNGAATLTRTVARSLDDAGRLHELTLPSGAVLAYRYGTDGRVAGIDVNGVVALNNVEYFPFGEPLSWNEGAAAGAFRYTRTFDADGRIDGATIGDGVRTIGYDASSRLASLDEDGASWTFTYDALRRIDVAQNAGTNPVRYDWNHDASGNRVAQARTVGATTTTAAYAVDAASNRIASIDGAARTYDASGNLASDGTYRYGSNARNKLSIARQQGNGAVVARYAYNAFGARVCKATGAGTCPAGPGTGTATNTGSGEFVQYVYDADGRLLGEYDANGGLIAEHVWLGDSPVALVKPSSFVASHGGLAAGNVAVFWIEIDHLDTPRAVVNASHATVWRWAFDVFGTAVANETPGGASPFAYSLRFPGQVADAETGTYYNYQRNYDPALGRYLESDPIGLEGGFNTYLYVEANPLEYADDVGLGPKSGGRGGIGNNNRRGKKYEYKIGCYLKNICDKVTPQKYVPVPGYKRGRYYDFLCERDGQPDVYVEVKTGGSNNQRQNDKDDVLRKNGKNILKMRKCKGCPGWFGGR